MEDEIIEETQSEETTSQETEELDLDQEGEQVESDDSELDAETLKTELDKTKELNAKLYARLKKNEAKKPVKTAKSSSNSSITRDETILFARGYTEEEVVLANKLAKIEGISTLAASEDAYVKAKVQERLKKEKSAKASLGASGGNAKFAPKNTGDMTTEEHTKLFHETMGNV